MGTGAGGAPLFIGNVLQKVKVIVDEGGTEAAAATMIDMKATGAVDPESAVDLTFDEPFIYLITDQASCTPLFMGIVTNPS
jgi:serpin B